MSQIENYQGDVLDILIKQMEEWTRQGRKDLVLKKIKEMDFLLVPRKYKTEFALFARRVDENLLSLKIMNPIIRAEHLLDKPPTTLELVTYAGSLTNLGFVSEALEIYAHLPTDEASDSLLHQAWIKFGRWEYEKAIPLVRRYLTVAGITDYMRVVGKVNLLAAFVAVGKKKSAIELAEELIKVTSQNGYQLLQGNTLELLSQVYIFDQNYQQGFLYLNEAEALLQKFEGLYLDLVMKWKLICQLMLAAENPIAPTSGALAKAENEMRNFKQKSLQKGQWEIVRDCELFLALAKKDEKSFLNVIGGSNSLPYRRRAKALWKTTIFIPRVFQFALGNGQSILDVRDRTLLVKPVVQQVLEALSQDLFKPFSVGTLFSLIYPGQYYDPKTSMKRIHNAIYLARAWLKKNCPEIHIEIINGEFCLRGQGAVIIYRGELNKKKEMLDDFPAKEISFTSDQLAQKLGISKRQAQYLIREGIRKKKIEKRGRGPATRYYSSGHHAADVEDIPKADHSEGSEDAA